MTIFHWRPFGFVLIDVSYLILLVGAFLPLCFLWVPATKHSPRAAVPWYDVVLIVLAMAIPAYLFANSKQIMVGGWSFIAPDHVVILSTILWLLVLEAGRRAGGAIFLVVTVVLTAYPLFGQFLPGLFYSPPFSFAQVVSFHAMSDESLLGLVLRVFGHLFFGYMVYAIVIKMLGAGTFFTQLAAALVGSTRAGSAKVAVVSSSAMGSISGDAISNVLVTGSFTIPTMKKDGMPNHYAGAVEACASSGGVLMPPVMGAVAFIMAELIEVPYSQVVLVAAVPAILYYVGLFAQIDAYAAREGLRPPPVPIETPPLRTILAENIHIILSFVALIGIIFAWRLTAQGPWLASGVALVLALLQRHTREKLRALLSDFWEDLGRVLGELMGIMAPVGMILGGMVVSGLAYSFPSVIVNLAGGSILLLLLLGALASFILGMGVTVSAAYIFLAIVLAPGLTRAGVDVMAAHMFVLYTATLSYITPPVALAAFAAATIAGSSPMRTAFKAMQLGSVKYLIPFFFVMNPALILRGSLSEILLAVPTATIGVIVMSGALEGYLWWVGRPTHPVRLLLFCGGALLMAPELISDLAGLVIVVVIVALALYLKGKSELYRFLIKEATTAADVPKVETALP